MLSAEVEADTLHLLFTALVALRRTTDAKEAALLWGDVLGPSAPQLTALLDAAYLDLDLDACRDAAKALASFESEPDDEMGAFPCHFLPLFGLADS